MVDAESVELLFQLILSLGALAKEGVDFLSVAQCHFADLAGFGIFQRYPAERGQLFLMRIGDLNSYHIVPTSGLLQRGDGKWIEEIG